MSVKGKMQLGIMFFLLFFAGAFYMQSDHELAMTQRTMNEPEEGIEPGEKAPNFILDTLSGESVGFEDVVNKKTILFFFTTWCHNCSSQWEQFIWAKNNGFLDNIQIIGINLTKAERNHSDIEHYVNAIPFNEATILIDKEGDVQDLYEIIGIPTSVLIDESGVVYSRNLGIIPMEKIKEDDFFSN